MASGGQDAVAHSMLQKTTRRRARACEREERPTRTAVELLLNALTISASNHRLSK